MADAEALRALVERAERVPDPCAALRTLSRVRTEIDALEQRLVARALGEGKSFADIARAIGISRQAAHRRYRELAGGMAPPAPDPPGSRVLITSEVRRAVALARREARALGAAKVGSEHLLLGVLCSGHPASTKVLSEFGITLDAARAHAQITDVASLATNGDRVPPGPEGISRYAHSVFEQSLREAVTRGDGYIGLDHLLLAALRDDGGGASRTVAALGVDAAALRERLAETTVTLG